MLLGTSFTYIYYIRKEKILFCVQCLVSLIPTDNDEEKQALYCQFLLLHPLALVNIPYQQKARIF